MIYDVLQWMVIGLLLSTVLFAGGILAREVWRGLLWLRLRDHSEACKNLVTSYQKKNFQGINKLLFQLRDTFEPEVIENVLREKLTESDEETLKHIREMYEFFQFTERYIQGLESPKWRVRAESAYALGKIGDATAVPALIKRMQDPDEDEQNVKMACAQALGMIRDPSAIPLLIEALKEVNKWSSVQVAELLVRFGKEAVPALLDALQNDESVNQRIWAAQILGSIGDNSAIPVLMQRLRDRDPNVRIASLEALGEIKSPLAVHSIIHILLHDPVSNVRSQAAISLGRLSDEIALQPLLNALNDPEYWTRLRAVEALELLGTAHIPHLTRILFMDPRTEVRTRAAQALERMGLVEEKLKQLDSEDLAEQQEAHRFLITMAQLGQIQQLQGYLHHPDFRTRYRVCEILGETGNPALEGALLEASKDEEWSVRIKALSYLAKSTSPQAIEIFQAALNDPDPIIKPMILESIKQLNTSQLERFYDQLVPMLNHDNIEVRTHAIELLARIPKREVFELLTTCLHDPIDEIRQTTIEVLGDLKNEETTPYLIKMLKDPNKEVRYAAFEALGKIKDERAIDPLLEALAEADVKGRKIITRSLAAFGLELFYPRMDYLMGLESPEVEQALCWILGDTGDEGAIRILKFFLQNKDANVRAAAIGSLGRIPHKESARAVLQCAHDVNKRVRASVANALHRIGIEEGLEELALLLKDPDPFVRNRAALSLSWLSQQPWIADKLIERYQEESHEESKLYLLIAIGLQPSEKTFQFVLSYFHIEETRQKLLELLKQENDLSLEQRFFKNLKLEQLQRTETSEEIFTRYLKDLQESQEIERREAAIDALEILIYEDSLPYLLDCLMSDPEIRLRQKASHALGILGEKLPHLKSQIREGLLESLSDPVPSVCEASLKALHKVADHTTTNRIFDLLSSKSTRIQQATVQLLVSLNRYDASDLLDIIAGTDSPDLMKQGIHLLKKVQDPNVISFLKVILLTKEKQLRLAAIKALEGHLQNQETHETLLSLLNDRDRDIRLWSIRLIGASKDLELIQHLANSINDPYLAIRLELIKIFKQNPHEELIKPLFALLHDPIEEVRFDSFLALAQIDNIFALQHFLEQLKQTPLAFRKKIIQNLQQSDAFELQKQRFQNDPSPQIRRLALLFLVVTAENSLPFLIEALQDPAPEVRKAALNFLLTLPAQEVQKHLHNLIYDPDPEIRKIVRKHLNLRLRVIDER